MKSFYVYVMSSHSRVIYIGVTNDLERRVFEHRSEQVEGFTKKYRCKYLVYFKEYSDPLTAIEREKQLKKWNRSKKIALIESVNPSWKDLSTSSR